MPKNIYIIIKYCFVGCLGTLIDVGLLFFLVEYFHVSVILAATISFTAAVINNFLFNKFWTFQDDSKKVFRQYLKFLIVSSIGLVFNNLLLLLFISGLHIWYVYAKLLTSLIILCWNFISNKFWTFANIAIPKTDCEKDLPVYELSIVVPAYNEEQNIYPTLQSIVEYCANRSLNYEIIVVDDGSKDRTIEAVENFARNQERIKLVKHEVNLGKGQAVKTGMTKASGQAILFLDADNSTSITELEPFLNYLQKGYDIVIGSRYLQGSQIVIKQPWHRILIGRLGNFVIRFLLIDGVADTQCGFKLFSHAAAKNVFARQRNGRWAFDVEVLAIAKNMGYIIAELPIAWYDSTNRTSRFRTFRDTYRTFIDVVVIKLNLMTRKYH